MSSYYTNFVREINDTVVCDKLCRILLIKYGATDKTKRLWFTLTGRRYNEWQSEA